jgi:hypothetical protein
LEPPDPFSYQEIIMVRWGYDALGRRVKLATVYASPESRRAAAQRRYRVVPAPPTLPTEVGGIGMRSLGAMQRDMERALARIHGGSAAPSDDAERAALLRAYRRFTL